MRGDSGAGERSGEIYLPYVGHVTEHAVLLNDGSVMTTAAIAGVPFELEDMPGRNARHRQLNTLLRNISDDNVLIASHLVRHRGVEPAEPGRFRSAFAGDLAATYRERVLGGRLYRNEHFVSVVVSPRNPVGRAAGRHLSRWRRPRVDAGEAVLRTVEDVWQILSAGLDEYSPRRLGLREAGGVLFSEVAEAMRLVLTNRFLPVPLVSGSLGAAIYTDRVICGRRGFEVRPPGRPYFGAMFSFREYPARTRPGMLDGLLSAPFPLVLSQSFGFLTRAQAHGKLSLKAAQMASAQDKAASQMEALAEAEDELASNEFVMGSHHLSLAIYADAMAELADNGARARALLTDAGAVVVAEGIGTEAAYWSQLPGNIEWRTRPGAISSRNFAAFSPFDSFPAGSPEGWWGPALTQFRTVGGTAYDYVPHVADVGMTAIFGPVGSGKTTLLVFLLAMLEQAMVATDKGGSIAFFDKDRGGELLVRATGGRYLVIRRGEASGLAPLRGLPDTPASADFLQDWLTGLIRSDGGEALTPEEGRRLARGVKRQLALPVDMRSVAGLREFLGYANPLGAGARLERWCRGGSLGWAFDNDADEVALDAGMVGFDLTQVLEHEQVCAPVAAYLLHRVGSVVDGRRFVMSCDEFRAYLLNPMFAAVVDRFLLTVRKNNGMLILATQQPEHVLDSDLGASLVAQCQTKILYPSPTADESAYIDGLKCTPGEFRAVREDMAAGSRRFLLKREAGSVICDFDLSAMPEYVAVLSGRANTVRLADKLRAELGDDPAAWLPEFFRRYRQARD